MTEPAEQTDEDVTEDNENDTTDAPETDADYTDALDTDTDVADTTDTDAVDRDAPRDDGKLTEAKDKTVKEAESESTKRDEGRKKTVKGKRKGKERTLWKEKCMERMWTCDDMPLWRVYMKSYAEDQEQLEKEDRFKRRKAAKLPQYPRVKSEEEISAVHKCLPLNMFQDNAALPNKLNRQNMIRIWKNMRANFPVHLSKSNIAIETGVPKTDSEKWSNMWPCTTRDLTKELKERLRRGKRKRRDIFPCEEENDTNVFDVSGKDFADCKELGHARIPRACPEPKKEFLVDRAAGENPGLVDGDYIIFELPSKTKGIRVYADVCLRGLKGMHLPELRIGRERQKTWKFCFYQGIVALLAKTQLRYKYAWSANIDYIYDHAWMLFTHVGAINIKERQRLDDIVVYNYKYSIELELIQETKDVPVVTGIPWNYEEKNLKRKITLERKELMNVKLEIGCEKITDTQNVPVHKAIKKIEDWFDNLPIRYRNCIFRTPRYSLAFWKDNLFWYLYNPYRCDEFGYWDDKGYACILKFCSKESLKRHLMILLLRAYAYTVPKSDITESENETVVGYDKPTDGFNKENVVNEETITQEFYTVQIYNVIYHCCQIHNLKLLQRTAPRPPQRLVNEKRIDDCTFDPLDFRNPCTIEQEDDLKDPIEKPTWLKLYKVTWAKCGTIPTKKRINKESPTDGKMRWHQYAVEESNKLFSLWGEVHITDGMFENENRGMQTYACYVVCAGMTRIMAPEYWSSKTLDVIVMCGDRYYTHSKLEAEYKSTQSEYNHITCWSRYLTSHFKIGETMFEVNVLPAICGNLYTKSSKYLWQSLEQMFLKYHFGILTCESSCLGVFKFCGGYYMCDVNSFGPPLFQYGEGAAYLLRTTYFYKFLTILVVTIGSPECSQFALNPIEILKVMDVGTSRTPLDRIERKEKGKRINRVQCPYDEEKKKQMKKWKHRRAETTRTIDKTCCKGND